MLPIYKYSVSDITKDEVKTITEKKRKPINIHTLSCTFQGKKNTTCVVGDEQLDEVKKNGYFEQKRQFGLGEFANYILQFSTYVKETGRIYFMPEYTNEIVEAIHSLFLFAGIPLLSIYRCCSIMKMAILSWPCLIFLSQSTVLQWRRYIVN